MRNSDHGNPPASPPAATSGTQPNDTEEEGHYPPFLDYLQSKQGHETASRVLALFENIQTNTLKTSADQRASDLNFHHTTTRLWLKLQTGIVATIIMVAGILAWVGKLDATVAALMGTVVGYYLRGMQR